MRDLFRFFFRQRNNLLFLVLMGVSIALLVTGNMHHRAQAISSSNAVVARIYDWRQDITSYADLRAVNRDLASALAQERMRTYADHRVADSTATPSDSLGHQLYTFFTARVINSSTHKQRNYITLDRGSIDGLHPDMGVVGVHGIVGIVREASPHFAVVTSVLTNEFNPTVMMKRTGHFGLLTWDTGDPNTASFSNVAKHVPVQVGDTIVTMGNDGMFPRGIPVGIVLSVNDDPGSNFHDIRMHLTEDMTRTAYVQVVVDLLKAERDSIESKVILP